VEVPPYGDVAAAVVAGMVPQPADPVTVKVIELEASVAGAFDGVTVMVSLVPGANVAPPVRAIVGVGAAWTVPKVSEALTPPKVTVAVPPVEAGVVPTRANETLPVSSVVRNSLLMTVPFQVTLTGNRVSGG
jgi:hypothetical protein